MASLFSDGIHVVEVARVVCYTHKILSLHSFYCQSCCVRISKRVRRGQTTKSLLFGSCDSEPDLNLKATNRPE